MAQEHINLGTPPAGVDGDTTRAALQKCEDNFNELYPLASAGTFKNKLINGNFDWWQRGVSFTVNGISADRWVSSSLGTTFAASQQNFATNQTAVPNGPAFFLRTVVTSVGGAPNFASTMQKVEDVRLLAGKTVTVSFWAKADAARPMGVGMMQDFGIGGAPSPQNILAGQKINLTAAWQYFSVTFAVPAIGANVTGTSTPGWTGVRLWYDCGSSQANAAGNVGQQSGTFDIAQVQLEVGSIATPFEMRPLAVELAMCQRYFEKSYSRYTVPASAVFQGSLTTTAQNTTSNLTIGQVFFKACKPGVPIVTIYNPSTGATGTARNASTGADVAVTVTYISDGGFNLFVNNVSVAASNSVSAQWIADAEI